MNEILQLGVHSPFGYLLIVLVAAASIFNVTSLVQTAAFRRPRSRHLLWLGVILPLAASTIGALLTFRRLLHYTQEPTLDWPFASLLAYAYFLALSGLGVALLGCVAYMLPSLTRSPHPKSA